jgi:hypothetical protein
LGKVVSPDSDETALDDAVSIFGDRPLAGVPALVPVSVSVEVASDGPAVMPPALPSSLPLEHPPATRKVAANAAATIDPFII